MVTIVDIAKRAGVSHQVVSKVLHGGRSNVGAGKITRQQILRLANELGYRPHAASQALRQRAFRSMGVLMGSTQEFYLPQEALTALSQRLAAHDYTCTLVCTESFDAQHILESRFLKAQLVDLLLISYVTGLPPAVLETLDKMGVPTVWLIRRAETDSVYVDEADATGQLVRHLASLGHRQIAFVDYNSPIVNPVLAERLRGFETTGGEVGVETQRLIVQQVPRETRFATTREWLGRPDRPRAVIVNSLSSAQVIMQTAQFLGLRVPEDFAVASFDDGTLYLANVPTITCAVRSNTDFGIAAAEMALEKVRHPRVEMPSRCLKYHLAVGGSTTPSNARR